MAPCIVRLPQLRGYLQFVLFVLSSHLSEQVVLVSHGMSPSHTGHRRWRP